MFWDSVIFEYCITTVIGGTRQAAEAFLDERTAALSPKPMQGLKLAVFRERARNRLLA
jgi:hypothetical protein